MDMQIPHALLEITDKTRLYRTTERPEFFFSDQLNAHYDPATHAVWSTWSPAPRPSFNPDLLKDLSSYCRFVAQTDAEIECLGERMPIEYTVLASAVPGVFNLGGDLDLFVQLIERRDRSALLQYGKACVDVLYRNYIGHGLPVSTISLVQGECLGGGFEAALSSDIIIAERHARFGFPEILFNLFPGMGALSLLARRIGMRQAEELILSGKILPAAKLHEMGVVDVLAPNGQGETAVRDWITSNAKRRNGMQAMHLHRTAATGVVGLALERDDAAAICLAGSDVHFDVAEECLRDPRAALSGGNANLDMHSGRAAVGERR